MISLPADAEQFIPHRGKMRFINTIESVDSVSVVVGADLSDNLFLTVDGRLDPVACAELAAQACAAFNGYRHSIDNEATVRLGFLAGISDFFWNDTVWAADKVLIELTEETCIPPFSVVTGKIITEKGIAAEGKLKLYESDESFPLPESVKAIDAGKKQDWREPWRYENKELSILERAIVSCGGNPERNSGGLDLEFIFPERFPGFDGHFPDFTLLPGVVMLKTAAMALDYFYGDGHRLKKMRKIKFGRPVFPMEKAVLKITVPDTPEGRHTFVWKISGNRAASGEFYL